ncbi:phenylalanine--tRNA ligase subunit beta [Carnobacteriaceae bacterium zg-C25]|nr:phenylalanine--tRNA ligase subunit beta [Carnobacteriaceae bacterium zg-C25]
MFVSKKWLNELIDVSTVKANELADKLSTTGIEVEGVENIASGLKNIVVGYTHEVVDHPDSDHLHICQVEVGDAHVEGGMLQIVCGASNIAAHQKVIVALPGARIVDNIKIKKGKIRGQVSNGMICSLDELGVSSNVVPKAYSEGIFVLPEDAPIGVDAMEYLQLNDDVLELSVTANRADALSMYGVAYEVGAIFEKTPHFPSNQANADTTDVVKNYIETVSVVDDSLSAVYSVGVVKDVTIKESPVWLQSTLMKMGIRPLNNVVDVTNYMLLLYGQPMHAFDVNKLGKDITVRLAKENERLVTLDEQERTLTIDDIVITSSDVPVALAGVMGGHNSEITNDTTTIALEVALFNPQRVRATSKRLGLRSESSARFEKGIHVDMMTQAMNHALALIAELGEGVVVSEQAVVQNKQFKSVCVDVSLEEINRKLGTQLTLEDVEHILVDRLGFGMTSSNHQLTISVPTRRFDISIAADVIEEVARIYGYDRLPSTLPTTPSIQGGLSPLQRYLRLTRRLMESVGYSQVISYSLTSEEKANRLAEKANEGIRLAMPMSEERSTLRRSLLTTMLDIVSYNVARNNTNLALYETGRVFYRSDSPTQADEKEHVALVLTGNAVETSWQETARGVDFYDIKGALDRYFEQVGIVEKIRYEATQKEDMHPGRTANIVFNGEVIGFVGQLHPKVAQQLDLKDTYVAEFAIEPLLQQLPEALVQTTVPKFPSMTRDVALLVDKHVTNAQLVDVMYANGGRYLSDVTLFDLYQGAGIDDDKKSLAYRLTFMNLEATLVEEDITRQMTNIQDALIEQTGAIIR